MKVLNILLVSHDLNVCGAPNSLLRQAKYFKSVGHNVTVWALRDGPMRPIYEEAGFSPVIVNDSYEDIIDAYDKTKKNFDFILCNTIVTYKCVKFFKNITPHLVWFIRETKLVDDWMLENKEFAQEYKSFKNIYTVSEYAKKVSEKYNQNINWFPNSIVDTFKDFKQSDKGITFGYIGSIISVKGIDLLVHAFLKLNQENKNTKLIIAGCEGLELEQKLKELTKNNESVTWLGQIQGEEKEKFFDNIDVLCVPSLDDPCPLTVIEGAMRGKIIITTDKVGSNYIVDDKNSGFIIKSGDEDELLNVMQKVLSSNISDMQKESRRQYLNKGTIEREKQDVLKMLKNTMKIGKKRIFSTTVNSRGRVRVYFYGIKIASFKKGVNK